jgi:hypothetical protein
MRRLLFVVPLFLLLAFVAVPFATAQSSAENSARWKPLDFLLGTWEAKTAGQKVAAAGTYTFQIELNGTVVARHSSLDTCKGPADFDCKHGDFLYLFHDTATGPDDSGLRAIYFDSEGHVIHYTVSQPWPNMVVFQSVPSAGPQFRLTYELASGIMKGKFQVLPPGMKDYQTYLEWSGKKTK